VVVICANMAWNLVNFRSNLIKALLEHGYEVAAVAPPDRHASRLEELGATFIALPMDNKGVSPFRDLILLVGFWRLLRAVRPCAYLGYTIKPNIWGSFAARLAGVPAINNISGLGTAFIRETWLTKVVCLLYWAALSGAFRVFFQNPEDRALFLQRGLVNAKRAALLPGSGIDLDWFQPRAPSSGCGAGPRFLLIARLLWDKGVGEYVAAARLVRARHPGAVFQLAGMLDVENRTAIDAATVNAWVAEGVIDYAGPLDDVRPAIADADCIVLPSYREGAPRTLLEAQAMGRPVIATDVPGCREVVVAGETGLLCRVRDAEDLARAMLAMIDMSAEARQAMGAAARRMVEARFDEAIVIKAYLDAVAAARA